MQILKERNPLFIKILAAVLLVLLCGILSKQALLWKICKGQNRSLLEEEIFWQVCKEEQEALFWETCAEFDRNLPPNTELLVSACTRPVLFVHEELTDKMYLLDLRTGEKRKVPDDPLLLDHGIFLSSELLWLEGSLVGPDNPAYSPHYILDLTDGKRYELLDLTWLPLKDGNFDPKYFSYFQSAEQIFIHPTKRKLTALAPDFRQHPEGNVIFSESSLEYDNETYKNGQEFEKLMKELGVDYQVVDFSLGYADVPSPTGRYVVRGDGIYLSVTNMLVVSRGEWRFIGWYYNESGVVIQGDLTFLYHATFGGGGVFPVPHPILKLRLPVP